MLLLINMFLKIKYISMKKLIKYLPIIGVLFLTSCLKGNLDELPTYKDAEISRFRFEYRWFDDVKKQLKVVQLTTQATITVSKDTIKCNITVPPVSASLPAANRNDITLSTIVGYCDISTAASIKPLANAPKLGEIEDFSKTNMQYEVTAADGKTKKTWNLVITSFVK